MKTKILISMVILAGLLGWLQMRQSPGCCDVCLVMPDLSPLLPGSPRLPLPYAPPPGRGQWQQLTPEQRLADVRARLLPQLHEELAGQGAALGDAAFLRIFKEERQLEVWLQPEGKAWALFRSYAIAAYSGTLGPKLCEGDGQAPEGFYAVTRPHLNPASSYHLSFNIGYPNAYDAHHQRTGSLIMIHGDVVSSGCFAMTDPLIEEIYLIVEAALSAGQPQVPVHVYPFHLTAERLAEGQNEPWHDFWSQLQPAYAAFESGRRIPTVAVRAGRYVMLD